MKADFLPSILLVTTKADIAADYVVVKLADLGASFYRINTEDFPLLASSTIRVDSPSQISQWSWVSPAKQDVLLDGIKCIWYRRHRLPVMPQEMLDAHVEYCLRESDWYLKGAIYSRRIISEKIEWMSDPSCIQLAESKIYQLSLAQSLGFKLPDTIVSNNPDAIRGFFEEKHGDIIAKPLRLGYFDYGNRRAGVYTSKVEKGDLEDELSLKVSPVIYQELLPKLFDIRVTVVDQDLFAVAIDSQSVPSAMLDWRRADTDALGHHIHCLPHDIAELCLKLVKTLGLSYGAIDLVLSPDNEYFFLEINPNGQWVWMEDRLALPISDSIATWLFNRSKGGS